MARIPLRSYNREIENLIDRGQIEEAIAHSKNILKQYPRHVETYRLLGKAFLESQRYSEALDILQRVLSVIPDDFVAQLGMSIIREDENNMDAAIWHMERAYEVQPFNRAVQDELRRLYGRRDGAEPPRIRLTRGSLVRMYARGELYPQAIAETRAALAEDPQRLDLTILLARLYYLSGQKVEAAEIASSLITKLPYCVEANRILMEILPETSRAEEARAFQRKVYDLDPYIEFITPHTPTSSQVPDQTVMVEHFDWQPSMQENQAPDWARNIGLQWEEKQEEDLPDWLNTVGSPTAAPQEGSGETSTNELVPDFMRDAGWNVATSGETESSGGTEEEPSQPEFLASADIPEWLQSMAPTDLPGEGTQEGDQTDWINNILPPAQASSETTPAGQIGEEPSFDWLTDDFNSSFDNSLASTPSGTSTAQPVSANQSIAPDIEDDVPDWLKEMKAPEPTQPDIKIGPLFGAAAVAAGTAALFNQPEDQTKDFHQEAPVDGVEENSTGLKSDPVSDVPAADTGIASVDSSADLVAEAQIAAPLEVNSLAEASNQPNDLNADLVTQGQTASTLEEDHQAEASSPSNENPEIPSWLMELGASGQQGNENPPVPIDDQTGILAGELTSSESPDSGSKTGSDLQPTESPVAQPNLDDMDQAMAWLEALAAKQGADAVSLLISKPEERSETPPGWITEFSQENEKTKTDQTIVPSPIPDDELPSWLRDDVTEEALGSETDATELPLPQGNSLEESQWVAEEDIVAEKAPGLTRTELPLGDTQPIAILKTSPPEAEPVTSAPNEPDQNELGAQTPSIAAESAPNLDDMDSAMAWLEALAAKQGAESGTLTITDPQSRSETTPDWINQLAAEDTTRTGEDIISSQPAVPLDSQPASNEDEGSSWLAANEDLLAIEDMDEAVHTPTSDTIETQPIADTSTPESVDSDMSWLEALAATQESVSTSGNISDTPTDSIVSSSRIENLPSQVETAPVSDQTTSHSDTPAISAEIPSTAEIAEGEPSAEADIPDWLLNYEEDLKGKPGSWDSSVPPTQVSASDESFTLWLKRNHPEPTIAQAEEVAAEANPPLEPANQTLSGSPVSIEAQSAVSQGDFNKAVSIYAQMIQNGKDLDAVIHQLSGDLDRHPVNVHLWQTLGDAYIKANKIQEALDAYTKAEELLR